MLYLDQDRQNKEEGIEQAYFICSGCVSAKQKGSRLQLTVFSLKLNLAEMAWIGSVDQYEHICVPKNVNEVAGTNVRQSIQAELASGHKKLGLKQG
uniref:Uncharacterized protein n=1 Tax=Ditylenchus dipsaci TaxID=166011 RepID=A0A915E041_9BILA